MCGEWGAGLHLLLLKPEGHGWNRGVSFKAAPSFLSRPCLGAVVGGQDGVGVSSH